MSEWSIAMRKKSNTEVITIPITVFETAESKEDIEDWLFAQNSEFIERMRRARQQDLEGQCLELKALARVLGIES